MLYTYYTTKPALSPINSGKISVTSYRVMACITYCVERTANKHRRMQIIAFDQQLSYVRLFVIDYSLFLPQNDRIHNEVEL